MPLRKPKSPSKSPVRRPAIRAPLSRKRSDSAGDGRRVTFDEPAKEVPKEAGPIALARQRTPRLEGESRTQWKNRIFDRLRRETSAE